MTETSFLADRFEAIRSHLWTVAYRMLGSATDADDAVQTTFLRVARSGSDGIDNLRAWLTTIVARVCLDMLRQRKSRSEIRLEPEVDALPAADNPERDQLMVDSLGVAMLVVLETLTPAERVAFVLHDMFNVPFSEIAPVIERSPSATRQLASRGRRRVQGAGNDFSPDRTRQRQLVTAFLTASQNGDRSALLALLDPAVVLRADARAIQVTGHGKVPALSPEIRGRDNVAEIFNGRLRAALIASIEGETGLAFARGGRPGMLVEFALEIDRIVEIDMTADEHHIATLKVTFPDGAKEGQAAM